MRVLGIVSVVSIVASGLVAASCASGPEKKKPIMTVEEYEENTPEPGAWEDPCTDDEGEPLQCESDDDCCEGYTCLKDPQRSRIVKHCLEL